MARKYPHGMYLVTIRSEAAVIGKSSSTCEMKAAAILISRKGLSLELELRSKCYQCTRAVVLDIQNPAGLGATCVLWYNLILGSLLVLAEPTAEFKLVDAE